MKIDFNPAVIVNGSERIVLEKLKYYHEPTMNATLEGVKNNNNTRVTSAAATATTTNDLKNTRNA